MQDLQNRAVRNLDSKKFHLFLNSRFRTEGAGWIRSLWTEKDAFVFSEGGTDVVVFPYKRKGRDLAQVDTYLREFGWTLRIAHGELEAEVDGAGKLKSATWRFEYPQDQLLCRYLLERAVEDAEFVMHYGRCPVVPDGGSELRTIAGAC